MREAAGDDDDISVPTDLRALVTAITAAGDEMDVHAPPSPWLPALPERVVLADLWRGREPGDAPVVGVVPPLPIGLGDHPREQRQDPMTWDVERGGHLAFAGQPRSGRSSALRVVAGAVADAVSPRDLHLYGIDCGNNALLPLVALPHVGAVVSRDQQDRVRRLVALLGREVARRQTLLAEQGFADVAEQRRAVAADGRPDERLPYLVVLLDRWEGFVAAYEQVDSGTLVEQVTVLMREGAAVGLRFVVSGDRSLVTGRMSTLLEDRVVLRLAQAEDYSLIGMRPKDVPASMPEGRAFRAGGPTEVQVALLDDDPAGTAQVAALQALARRATAAAGDLPHAGASGAGRRAAHHDLLGRRPPAVAHRRCAPSELLVGVGGDTLGLVAHDVLEDGPGLPGRRPAAVGPQHAAAGDGRRRPGPPLAGRRAGAAALAAARPRRRPRREGGLRRHRHAGRAAGRARRPSRRSRIVVVDDYEVMGADHPLVAVLDDYLKQVRDHVDALVVACGVDEVQQYYRGPTAAMRRARTGVLMAPRSASDGDVFTTRLPRSVAGTAPRGRAIRVSSRGWEWVQVPSAGPSDARRRARR